MAEPDAPKAASEQQNQNGAKGESNAAVRGQSNSQHNNHHQAHSIVTVGNFEIGQTIGRGTFGKVKLGIHKITNEKVAVKVLDKDKLIDSADKKRLQREISILRKIRHPNIIQLYEIIETPRQLYLFMEYAPNGELFDYIVKRTRLSERQASKFLQQIINGIEYMSKIGVVHRDLKPENLLLDHNYNIKIVDFGLSNTYKDNEKLKTACGSPCYAAPEMVAGKPYNGLQTDIWSSGVILYAMLCGYLPFEDQNTSVLYKKIMNQDPVLPSFLSSNSKGILSGILTKDPEKRYNIQDIRLHPFCKEREPILQGIIVGVHEIPVDQNILKQLEKYQINVEQAEDMVKRNKHNNITSVYNLLLLKFIREGGKSNADLQLMKKARSDNLNVLKQQNTTHLSSQQQEQRQKPNQIANQIVTPILQTVSTAAPPSVAATQSNNTQGQDNVTKFTIQHNQLYQIFQNYDSLKEKEDIKEFSPAKNISYINPAPQAKPREYSHQPREAEQQQNKEKHPNKYHSASPTREHHIEENQNQQKQKTVELGIKDNMVPEFVDITHIQKASQADQKLASLLDNTQKQNLPRLGNQGNTNIYLNPLQKRIPIDKLKQTSYMLQSSYQKKQNNFVDANYISNTQGSVPSQSKKQSIAKVNYLNNSSMFEDPKDSQKYKVNSSFQYANASKYSVGDEEDKLIMVNSVQTNSNYNKSGLYQNSKKTVQDSALNTTQDSPKNKQSQNANNLSMLLQRNYQFPINVGNKNVVNSNNNSQNNFSKTRYLSVQRQQQISKPQNATPTLEEKKNFRISSYSIHMRGNSTQYNTRNSNDNVLNLSLNQAATQNQSKRASINSIKQQQPIPLQEKLININLNFQGTNNTNTKRLRKKIISMHDTSYNPTKQNSFNAGKMNKENSVASNSGSKQEIRIFNNMEFLSYGSVNNNLNNHSLELEIENNQKNLQQNYQTCNGTRGNKIDVNNSLVLPKGIPRVHTDENDKNNQNKNGNNQNKINAIQINNSNNSNAISQRSKKTDQSKSENIKLNKILPFSIQTNQIANNSMVAGNINNLQIQQNLNQNSQGGGSSQSSGRVPSYKFRKVKPNQYEDQFNLTASNEVND
ncbi:Serine/Threonine kinase domain protein (macronuclear) [Tetrahymena thermophila SB210]|uniref:Serine/Threonine kinase domain protein n=1 Tax=Tetrahymena thermophila (strain SB210) TaxID=312017 RepID=Q22SK1_TETTS|nr:Serine/Threonine kinase domain protein [Tetrahymena thermophila SB210]EAR87771.2 Serine/Threonine kinase domain protein [Tetrahymena thermophila SB210]|eukprot:XP_001008016.2 Serine/Threonine kinase domain protein [Tetrahymena thermophila SB210]